MQNNKTRIPKFAYMAVVSLLATVSMAGCAAAPEDKTVTLVTHDSFVISDELTAQFETESGYQLELIKAGDTGSLTNKLVLTKDAPIGDVVFGIDNTYASVATDNGIIDGEFSAVDFGDVCFNYDKKWFAENNVEAPASIEDLTDPVYRGLTVITDASTSSPGLAFLATAVSTFGEDGYAQYLEKLEANGVKVAAGWEDAYFTDFSGSSGKGEYPIVLSYSSSPSAEVREDGKSQTAAILDGCFRQTELAGVLKGTDNPEGAKVLIEFLLGEDFQSSIPESMYVYPVNADVALPEAWTAFAPAATETRGEELDIATRRSDWLATWKDIFG